MSPDEKQQVIEWKKQAFPEHSRARKVSLELNAYEMEYISGERDMNVLRKLVEKKVPGWETFLDEDGLPTDIGRLRLYKELGYRRVSK
ncbi:hypothetical protein JTE90_027531 [Oedothorax gibbosus]|uniref:Uncharacterized protein n=1 Tax=Oedothorax gibbosus TaxID=931172 RepID=A0AAV6VM97_9ARAC|nr:hypothetical protein JTE90_027531 [Oedothorax gibbosus]